MKALLIEDEKGIANFLMRGLKGEGYQTTHVEDGKNALSLMKNEFFDLIILDLLLPEMSGEEILKTMRARKDATPVIVLTGVDDPEIKTRLLNAGADDYLVKPFSFVELIARIRSVLRRAHGYQQPSEELVVGDLRLTPSTRVVMRGERSIKLRLKEYALLEYMMHNPDKVIHRDALIEKVWDYNAQLFSNTVDSHISLLRKKINEGTDTKLIETIHGIGYILRSKPLV